MTVSKTKSTALIQICAAIILVSASGLFSAGNFEGYRSVGKIETGVEPHFLFFDETDNIIHVFCTGADLNYDGNFDEDTDSKPSWHTVDLNRKTLISEEVTTFPFGSFSYSNYRPAFDEVNRKMYIPHGSKIDVYNVDSKEKISEYDAGSAVAAVDVNDDLIAVSVNPVFGEPGKIFIYKNEEKISEIAAGINTLDVFWITNSIMPENRLAFICNGPYGEDKGYYKEIAFNENFEPSYSDSLYVGKVPNSLSELIIENGTFLLRLPAIVVNGSHRVDWYMMNTHYIEPVGTGGWDGPRQATKTENAALVTTYAGDFRVFVGDENSYLEEIVKTDGRPEGIIEARNKVFVANQLKNDPYYSPNNIVEVFEEGDIRDDNYGYYSVPEADGGKMVCTVGEDFYTIDPAVGINRIICNGSDFDVRKIYDLDLNLVCRPAYIEQSHMVCLAERNKFHIFKLGNPVELLQTVETDFNIKRIISLDTEFEGNRIDGFMALNDNHGYPAVFQNGIYMPQEPFDDNDELDTELAMIDGELLSAYLMIDSADNASCYLEVEDEEGNTVTLMDGLTRNSDIQIVDTLLLVTELTNGTITSFNLNKENYPLLSKTKCPFTLGDVTFDYIGEPLAGEPGEFAFINGGRLTFFDLNKKYFTRTLPLSSADIIDIAELNKDGNHLIAALTQGETVIYANGLFVSVLDNLNSDFERVSLYPNPVRSTATVEIEMRKDVGNIHWQVITSSGRVAGKGIVKSGISNSFDIEADALNLSSGTYYLRMVSGNNSVRMVPFTVVK